MSKLGMKTLMKIYYIIQECYGLELSFKSTLNVMQLKITCLKPLTHGYYLVDTNL